MENLFLISINKYTLAFLSIKVEQKYRNNLTEMGGFQDRLAYFIAFSVSIIGVIYSIIAVYLSTMPGYTKYMFHTELFFLIIISIGIAIEITCLYFKFLSYFKGVFFIMVPIIVGGESSAIYKAYCTAISPNLFSYAIASIYIGIAINKIWYISSISFLVGSIYFIIRYMQYSNLKLFQAILFFSVILVVLIFPILIFYYTETILRKNFFSFIMLAKKEKQVKKVLKELPVSIFLKKGNGNYYLNKCMKRMVGITILEDKDIKSLTKMEKNIRYKEYIGKLKTEDGVALTDKIKTFNKNELQRKSLYLNQNGENFEFKIKGVKLLSKSQESFVYVLEELTQNLRIQKNIEKKYQKILIASVTHDLLTPVNGSLGLLEIILTKISDLKIRNKLIIVKNSITKLTYYIQLFKFYSLLEGNSLSSEPTVGNFTEVTTNCCELFKRDMKKKGIKLELKLPTPRLIIKTDFRFVSHIVFTLIQNAEKHTFKGFVHIECKIENKALYFEVEDTGEGIKEEALQNLFILYASSEKSNELNPQGIGLSLYVCKKLSQRLEGDLICNSSFGKGSRFIFSIPNCLQIDDQRFEKSLDSNFEEPPQKCVHNQPGENLNDVESHSSRNIIVEQIKPACICVKCLIVDDDLTNIKVLKSYFKSVGIGVDSAFNGAQAVDLVKHNNGKKCCQGYTLIIMDINMPVMDGEEATRNIKRMAKNNEISKPIIVGLTAAQIHDQAHKKDFIQAGFDDIINKPLPKKRFIEILKTYHMI